MRSSLLLAIVTAVLVVIVGAPSGAFAQAKRQCLPGTVETNAGKPWDPTFKGKFKCTPSNLVSCGNGSSCPRGATCLYKPDGGPAGCKGVRLGALCRDGKHCPAGYLCVPSPGNGCYNPNISYTCGVAICANGGRYLPGDRCYPCYVRRGGR